MVFVVGEELSHVKADAAGPDDGHRLTNLGAACEHVDVGQDLVVVDAGQVDAVAAAGMRSVVVPSVMSEPAVAARLAEATLAAARG